MIHALRKVFHVNERELKKYMKKVEKINAWEETISQLSDDALKEKTNELKKRYKKGETLDELLVEAFAVVREASKRVTGMRHYDVQLIGGMVLHDGKIAEMKTGEGKTLVSTLPSYLNALTEKGVHVITVNEYLAARDKEEMGRIHEFLGLSVGINSRELTKEEKQVAYNCDITYGTNNEFAFDYLRDNMVAYEEEKVHRGLHYCIIDEVDSILIDEARTPLIISGAGKSSTILYKTANSFVRTLKQEEDYRYDIKTKSVTLTESGAEKAERAFGIQNLYEMENVQINHHISQALKAHASMQKDIDYVVQDGEVIIVDQFTGRLMPGRRYSEGLHQAIESKEGLKIQQESRTLATVTFQNYFRMYEKLSGMTGTAKTEEDEFRNIYGVSVVVIPTNRPVQRMDQSDFVYMTQDMKFNAVIEEIAKRHAAGQPVLVGTANIETSELLSEKLKKKGIKHEVLNAKQHDREAEIVANAGEKGAVTIATNMAGRGTDIKLPDEVRELGGLYIIGTEKHESRRIDNQLRGRAGRQGDPGESRFYLSMEDELMRRFGSESTQHFLEKMGMSSEDPIESKLITKAVVTAQKRVEGNNFETRKQLLKYDNILNEQRLMIYEQRDDILRTEGLKDVILTMVHAYISKLTLESCEGKELSEEEKEGLIGTINANLFMQRPVTSDVLSGKTQTEAIETLFAHAKGIYEEKEKTYAEETFREFEKIVTLKAVDTLWIDHIDAMSQLKEGIHLRAYAQTDPLREYQSEGFTMFEEMTARIQEQVAKFILNMELDVSMKREQVVSEKDMVTSDRPTTKTVVNDQKVGRNDPCHCGSGKKYKNCHGA